MTNFITSKISQIFIFLQTVLFKQFHKRCIANGQKCYLKYQIFLLKMYNIFIVFLCFFLLPVISHTCTIVPCKCLWCVITRFAFHSLFLLYNCTLHCYTYILHYHTYLQCLHFYSEGFFLHPLKYRLFRKLYLRLPCVFLAFCYFFFCILLLYCFCFVFFATLYFSYYTIMCHTIAYIYL